MNPKATDGDFFAHEPQLFDVKIEVERDVPRWSGLFNAQGQKLYRPQEPIGFKLSRTPQ